MVALDEHDDFIENGVVNDEDMRISDSDESVESSEEDGTSSPAASSGRRPSTRSSTNSDSNHPRRTRRVSYDTSLPAQHTYLGNDLEELSGRVEHDDDTLIIIPLLSLPGLVLVPGQTLPLQLHHPSLIGMMQKIIEKDRTFGLTSNFGALGTTAEVRSFGNEGNEDADSMACFRVKAEGRQRFIVKETWRQVDGILMGKCKVLPEVDLINPLKINCLPSATGFKYNRKFLTACTPLPSFVYQMYDSQVLMDTIKNHLESWVNFDKDGNKAGDNKVTSTTTQVATGVTSSPGTVVRTTRTMTTTIRTRDDDDSDLSDIDEQKDTSTRTTAPEKPCEFSYWVAANLPLEDSQRVEFLSLNCSIQRLRWLLSVLQKYLFLCCTRCKAKICHKEDIFSMSVSGCQATYVNPAGCVHETLTVLKAESLSLNGRPSTEFSWFPGYAWTVCSCSHCDVHIGWRFTATNKKLQPEVFYGISRSNLELGLKTDVEQAVWRPVI